MSMIERVVRWKCSVCKKLFDTRKEAQQHADTWHIACDTCGRYPCPYPARCQAERHYRRYGGTRMFSPVVED
jgi:hypothetical protein